MGRFRGLLLVAGLLAALLPAVVAAVGPQPGAPCEPTLLAAQVALFCAPGMATALCCDAVVLAVDLGVPCLCRVAAEPQLVTAGLDVTHLLKTYGSCGGLLPGVAHLSSAACEGPAPPAAVVSTLRPPAPASPAPRRTPHEASSQSLSSVKPRTPLPQEHDDAKPIPTQPATSPPAAPDNAPAPSPPPQESAAVNIFRIIGYVCTSVLYLSPIPMIIAICKTGDVGQHKIDVLIVTFTSCVVWLLYGVSKPSNHAMVIVNAAGAFVESIYIGIFVWYSSAVGRVWAGITLVMIVGILGFTSVGIFFSSGSPNLAFAILADASSLAMYLAPIREIMAMWNVKVVQNSSFAVAAASILNGACWTAYAALKDNTFLLIPNVAGIVSGIGQLLFFLVLRFKYQQQQPQQQQPQQQQPQQQLADLA